MQKNWTDLTSFLKLLSKRFKEQRCSQLAASLTFTTLLSVVPLITIALTLFSAFPVFDDFAAHIREFVLSNLMPETGGKLITRYMEQFAESAARLTAVGIGFLALTAMLMMLTIDNAFNMIWHVQRQRSLMQRVLIYWSVLTLGPLLIGGSLSLTSWLVGLSAGYANALPAFGILLLRVVPLLLTMLAFTLLFRVVPNRYVPLRHAFIGGLVGSIAFESMNRAFGLYIAHFPTYKLVYGAFASIPIFLLWIYLSWLTVLLGALIAASMSHWRSPVSAGLTPVTRLYYAMRVLKALAHGLQTGKVHSLPGLSRQLGISFDDTEQILDALSHAKIVRKLAGNGWVMIRTPEYVHADEVMALFVFGESLATGHAEDTEIEIWLNSVRQRALDEVKMPLSALFQALPEVALVEESGGK
ncbi:MAG: YihY family inner membrane protein [Pseudomonadota bacterium]